MKLRKIGFQGGRSALIASMMKYPEMESLTENKDISVNPFTDFTLSPKHNSKKDVKQWILYAKCMINGY